MASYLYLPIALGKAAMFAIRRKRLVLRDLHVLLTLVWASWPYMLGFKGKVAGPFGTIVVESRDKLKSAMYGAFKTNFCYMKTLEAIMPNTHSFDMVVDIGACVGDLPLAFSKISRRILAVEPGASNFSSLEA